MNVVTPAAVTVVSAHRTGLTRRGRTAALAIATLLALASGSFAAAAGVLPVLANQPGAGGPQIVRASTTGQSGWTPSSLDAQMERTGSEHIGAAWDGQTVHLDWQNNQYLTAEATFIGSRVIVPGDRVYRTLNVRNDGPEDAVMTVQKRQFKTFDEATLNVDLAQDVTMFWEVGIASGSDTFRNLYQAALDNPLNQTLAQVAVAQGETVPITIGFDFPADITDHRAAGEISKLLSFDVVIHMVGDEIDYTGPEVCPIVGLAHLPIDHPDCEERLWTGPEMPQNPPDLVTTGFAVMGFTSLAAALGIFGWIFLAASRRRRCELCDAPLRTRNRTDRCEGAPLTCEVALALAARS